MVPWEQANIPKAFKMVSVNRWLVSTFPPTTAGDIGI
jgi:hypothetical protein